jgi:hypothetical protein
MKLIVWIGVLFMAQAETNLCTNGLSSVPIPNQSKLGDPMSLDNYCNNNFESFAQSLGQLAGVCSLDPEFTTATSLLMTCATVNGQYCLVQMNSLASTSSSSDIALMQCQCGGVMLGYFQKYQLKDSTAYATFYNHYQQNCKSVGMDLKVSTASSPSVLLAISIFLFSLLLLK